MGFILFIVALVLTAFVWVCSIIFTPIYFLATGQFKAGLKRFNGYWRTLAVSIDQFGNGACGKFLQFIFIKYSKHSSCYQFGNIDETVSFCLGENKYRGNLNKFGKFMCWVLHLLEKNHVEIAIEFQKQNDKRAHERYTKNDYGI